MTSIGQLKLENRLGEGDDGCSGGGGLESEAGFVIIAIHRKLHAF